MLERLAARPDYLASTNHARPKDAAGGMPKGLIAACIAALVSGAIVILVIGQYTDLDTQLADIYFDRVHQTFPWDHSWFARDLMHGHVKKLILWFGLFLVAFAAIDLVRPFSRLAPQRRLQLRFLALASVFEPLLVRSLKESSNLHCPFSVDLYGGSQPLLRLLDAVPDVWPAGHCFPAGHASAGMWLSALAILWLPQAPRRALAVFAGGLVFGLFMGWVQQMRGMHFLSHTLATAWVSTALLMAMLVVFWQPLQRASMAVGDIPVGAPHTGNPGASA